MLSILIPTYNYNVFPLVQNLHAMAIQENIAYEIIVLDDASTDGNSIKENQQINTLENCNYQLLEKNIGRSSIRNLLAKKAQYKWLLFLDADTMPIHSDFIAKYLPHLNEEEKVIYGGIRYQKEKPSADKILRWVYGNSREALPVTTRKKAPYISLLTLNFAIRKSIFEKISFNESIPNLRHEDSLFSFNLSQKRITVDHIENPVYHYGLESSEIFMRKSEESVIGLKYLLDNNLISPDYIRISKMHNLFKKIRILPLAAISFKIVRSSFRKNLTGSNPSLFIFDLYRLGYICSLKA